MDNYFDYFMPDFEYFYEPQPVQSSGNSLFFYVFIAIIAVIALFTAMVFATLFIIKAIGMYSIAKNRGMKHNYLSIVPFANQFYLGKITDDINGTMNKKTNFAVMLVCWFVAGIALLLLSVPFSVIYFVSGNARVFLPITIMLYFLALLAFVIYKVYQARALYRIYKEYAPESAVMYEIFSVLFVATPFILFMIRNRKSGYEKWLESIKNVPEQQPEQQPFESAPQMPSDTTDVQTDPESEEGIELEEFEVTETE